MHLHDGANPIDRSGTQPSIELKDGASLRFLGTGCAGNVDWQNVDLAVYTGSTGILDNASPCLVQTLGMRLFGDGQVRFRGANGFSVMGFSEFPSMPGSHYAVEAGSSLVMSHRAGFYDSGPNVAEDPVLEVIGDAAFSAPNGEFRVYRDATFRRSCASSCGVAAQINDIELTARLTFDGNAFALPAGAISWKFYSTAQSFSAAGQTLEIHAPHRIRVEGDLFNPARIENGGSYLGPTNQEAVVVEYSSLNTALNVNSIGTSPGFQLVQNCTAFTLSLRYVDTSGVYLPEFVGCPFSNTPTLAPTTATPTQAPSVTPTQSPTSGSPTAAPSSAPSSAPTQAPSAAPTKSPTKSPTTSPTASPTVQPGQPTKAPTTRNPTTAAPTAAPSATPSSAPTRSPSMSPTSGPTVIPGAPTKAPTTKMPSVSPTKAPSQSPTTAPSVMPSATPTSAPSATPTKVPSVAPTKAPSAAPSARPTISPTTAPSTAPSKAPSAAPSKAPSTAPSSSPSAGPSVAPSAIPTAATTLTPSKSPSVAPSSLPSAAPSVLPSVSPSVSPTGVPTPLANVTCDSGVCNCGSASSCVCQGMVTICQCQNSQTCNCNAAQQCNGGNANKVNVGAGVAVDCQNAIMCSVPSTASFLFFPLACVAVILAHMGL